MRTFSQKQKPALQTKPASVAKPDRSYRCQSREERSILQLQHVIGNQAVQRLLKANGEERDDSSLTSTSPRFAHDLSRIPLHARAQAKIQSKLTINTPRDIYEQEADRGADQVMRMPEDSISATPLPSGGGVIQRICSSCTAEFEMAMREDRDIDEHKLCPSCHIQAKALDASANPLIRRKTDNADNRGSDTRVAADIDSLRGGGRPLPPVIRRFMEPRFGTDFSQIRIHTDGKVAKISTQISARAFTIGRNIAFAAGQYQPNTTSGRKLLAHELTHTIQQTGTNQQTIQRKIGDGHDLNAARFSGNVRLEAAYDNELLIRKGARGEHVSRIQDALVELGYALPKFGVDGIFGSETDHAVKSYQSDNSLKIDGIVGPQTMGDLDAKFTEGPDKPENSCKIQHLELESVNSFNDTGTKSIVPSVHSNDPSQCGKNKKALCSPLPFPRNGKEVTVNHICHAKQNAQIFDPNRTNPVDGSHNFCLNAGDKLKILQRPNIEADANKLIMIKAEILSGDHKGRIVFIQEAYINAESCQQEKKKEEKKKKEKKKKKKKEKKCIPTFENPFCLLPNTEGPCTPFKNAELARSAWNRLSSTIPLATSVATRCKEVKPVWEAYFNRTAKPFSFSSIDSCVVKAAKEDETASKTAKKSADSKMKDIIDNLPNTLDDIVPLPFPVFGVVATKRISLSKAIGKHGPLYLHPRLSYNNPFNAAGNIAGDVGSSDFFGKDDRVMGGIVIIDVHKVDADTGMMHGEVRWLPHIHVKDTADFCPGQLGNWVLKEVTIPMSKLESMGMTKDVPISIDYNLELRSAKFNVIPKSKQK